MLPGLLQGIETGGLLIIQDSSNYSGRDLLKSFITAALNREEVVHVLCFDVSEEELRDRLKPLDTQRLHIHDAYSDPLGWTAHPAFTVQQFNSKDLTDLIRQTSQQRPATLVIDSLSWILRHATAPAVCRTLQQLRKGGAVRAIIGLLHTDMHQRGTVGSVCHLATSLISVAPGVKGNEAVARITKRSKSGKVMQDEEIFCITEDLAVTVLSTSCHPEPKPTNTEEEQADPTANLTFNLRLSDSELEAKQKLTLPFVFSKEKKTALLHPGPGSGRILYEPDANDDYDQEDPDDDLDI
ncbi:PREDICTED: elongator complex protein 5 [Cyprinodon variegatus]|uniref:Elongator complex protein 5 n=1 Tax=Cyprinodon variegatus TaxID=28743 RepID=A0A3Q2CD02_CYPVA|nr:PREDICTED: elongator complex protein 5 [Cyprinodon variegatus]XP_015235009.1 PREDICTED: elongator complex protein 5 [Cyprinodon variegatus]